MKLWGTLNQVCKLGPSYIPHVSSFDDDQTTRINKFIWECNTSWFVRSTLFYSTCGVRGFISLVLCRVNKVSNISQVNSSLFCVSVSLTWFIWSWNGLHEACAIWSKIFGAISAQVWHAWRTGKMRRREKENLVLLTNGASYFFLPQLHLCWNLLLLTHLNLNSFQT